MKNITEARIHNMCITILLAVIVDQIHDLDIKQTWQRAIKMRDQPHYMSE